MITLEFQTECRWCGRCNTHITDVEGEDLPRDGDVLICIDCRMPSIYQDGDARRPTPDEFLEICRDPVFQKMRAGEPPLS